MYHAFVIDMVLAMGHGIPAPSEVSMFALAYIELRARRGWGFQCHKAPIGPRRKKQKQMFALANIELRAQFSPWREERNDEARSVSDVARK